MPVNLSIKNAPDHEGAVQQDRPASPADILADSRRLGLHTPSEATALIRADRDGRQLAKAAAAS